MSQIPLSSRVECRSGTADLHRPALRRHVGAAQSYFRFISAGLLCAGLAGCIAATPPGPGRVSAASQQRLSEAAGEANLVAVRNAAEAAANRPQDLRLQRKAIILAGGFAGGQRDPGRKAELLQLVSSAVVNADNSAASCDARGEIGNLYDAAGEYNKAGETWIRNAQKCRSYGSMMMAAQSLRKVERCPELLDATRALWPKAPQTEWAKLLNAVNLCSDAVSLRQNLSFVPEAVRVSYLEELARQHREAVAAAAAEQDRQDRYRRASACRSDCSSAGSSCYSGCPSGSYHPHCAANCRALESVCSSRCN